MASAYCRGKILKAALDSSRRFWYKVRRNRVHGNIRMQIMTDIQFRADAGAGRIGIGLIIIIGRPKLP